jgi:hypothetical protein
MDRLIARIQALRAKTLANGCTEGEALAAAAKVAELLDRYDLTLGDVEMRQAPCRRLAYEAPLKKRIPLDDCIGAIADFCNVRVWREKAPARGARHVFFGLGPDIEAAVALTELVDTAIRSELGRYKTTDEYRQFRHRDRDLANKSFMLGMAGSIADKLTAMKSARDKAKPRTGRDLIVLKTSLVDAEFDRLGLTMRSVPGVRRMISPEAYDAGDAVGASFTLDPAITRREKRSR